MASRSVPSSARARVPVCRGHGVHHWVLRVMTRVRLLQMNGNIYLRVRGTRNS